MSSPRKRGCFSARTAGELPLLVFPAQAGVFLVPVAGSQRTACLPRASGGVSASQVTVIVYCKSSPRKRGCFLVVLVRLGMRRVFPAQAGVFLSIGLRKGGRYGLPRASGGVSKGDLKREIANKSSPRKRGCFLRFLGFGAEERVFPAQAGVFRRHDRLAFAEGRLPRASGGVSKKAPSRAAAPTSSPRKRGCFSQRASSCSSHWVFPAQAGVFLGCSGCTSSNHGLPRASGGVSRDDTERLALSLSSPRKRGCF